MKGFDLQKEELIIITGKKGSGKKRMAEKLSRFYGIRKYTDAFFNAPLFKWSESNIGEIRMSFTSNPKTILIIDKQDLHKLLNQEFRRQFLIIDMDYERK